MTYRALSFKTGLRGRNDDERPLIDAAGRILPLEEADAYFNPIILDSSVGAMEKAVRAES